MVQYGNAAAILSHCRGLRYRGKLISLILPEIISIIIDFHYLTLFLIKLSHNVYDYNMVIMSMSL